MPVGAVEIQVEVDAAVLEPGRPARLLGGVGCGGLAAIGHGCRAGRVPERIHVDDHVVTDARIAAALEMDVDRFGVEGLERRVGGFAGGLERAHEVRLRGDDVGLVLFGAAVLGVHLATQHPAA